MQDGGSLLPDVAGGADAARADPRRRAAAGGARGRDPAVRAHRRLAHAAAARARPARARGPADRAVVGRLHRAPVHARGDRRRDRAARCARGHRGAAGRRAPAGARRRRAARRRRRGDGRARARRRRGELRALRRPQRALPRAARGARSKRCRRPGGRARDAAAVRLAGRVRAGPGGPPGVLRDPPAGRSSSTTRWSRRSARARARAPRTSPASTRAWRCATSRSRWRAGTRASACRAPPSSATEGDTHGHAHHAPVPRRPRRQPAAAAAADEGARGPRRRAHRRRRAARDRGRGDPRGRAQAGGGRPAVGHRRRVPPRLLAHGLHLPARRDHHDQGRQPQGAVPQRAGLDRVLARGAARDRQGRPARADLRRGVRVPEGVRERRRRRS